VEKHYEQMRTAQTLEFVNKMLEKYSFKHPRAKLTIPEAFKVLESYVDSSDPDVSLPNSVHMFQTAEGIRKAGHPDWMQLIGLIHDMGKIMFLWGDESIGQKGTAEGPQYALGGDTWVVGCKIPDCAVMNHYNKLNPDMANPLYNTDLGIYKEHCGLENLKFAYGHDEYLYHMLVANKAKFPPEAMYMVRFHSLYPWHTGGAYRQFMNEKDHAMLPWVLEFNKYDLYTKDDSGITQTPDELWPYYLDLIDKYFPDSKNLMW